MSDPRLEAIRARLETAWMEEHDREAMRYLLSLIDTLQRERDELKADAQDWVLCMDGVKHDPRCSNHFMGDPRNGSCLRCQVDEARKKREDEAVNYDGMTQTAGNLIRRAEAAEAQVSRLTEALRTLSASWKTEGRIKDSFHATMGVGWKDCATELDRLLASPAQEPQPG